LFLDALRSVPEVEWALPAGSLRRGQPTVGDITIVAAASDPTDAMSALFRLPGARHAGRRSARHVSVSVHGDQVSVRLADPAVGGAALLWLTGSIVHVKALAARAASMGYRLTMDGLHSDDGTLQPSANEDEIYQLLGLPFIPPEIRDGDEALAAALRGGLPTLVTRADIRGDLHMHSTWSDGHDSIETMVKACRTLSYEYVAITDHSPHSAASRNLTEDGVSQQADEIEKLRESYPDIAILHGSEVDILQDGRLDFPDAILERFDIVLASLHDAAGHTADRLLKRYESAMRHPLVNLITHPSNQLVPHRAGYDLDYDRLFELAVETSTALEIDGAPSHLDLDGTLAQRAIAAGATVAVDSDCHRADLVGRQMQLGILTARRGWVERRHVLNVRPLEAVRRFIASKRR
jgi:DNA polymerase (family 10)